MSSNWNQASCLLLNLAFFTHCNAFTVHSCCFTQPSLWEPTCFLGLGLLALSSDPAKTGRFNKINSSLHSEKELRERLCRSNQGSQEKWAVPRWMLERLPRDGGTQGMRRNLLNGHFLSGQEFLDSVPWCGGTQSYKCSSSRNLSTTFYRTPHFTNQYQTRSF